MPHSMPHAGLCSLPGWLHPMWRRIAIEDGMAFGADVPERFREACLRDLATGRVAWPEYVPPALRARIVREYGPT